MIDEIDEAHDRARLLAEHELGIGLVVGPNDTAASNAYERGWDDAVAAMLTLSETPQAGGTDAVDS